MKGSGVKIPVYLITAPVGEIMADMSLTAARVIPKLPLLIHENTGSGNGPDLVDRLREQKIIPDGQRLIPVDYGLPDRQCRQAIDDCLQKGESFGIMADSGMPCFVDPGIEVVRYLLDRWADNVELVPVGASSAKDAAIMASGVDCTRFIFMGHYPENILWFENLLGAGLPGIAYVRGDAADRFGAAATLAYGTDSELQVSIFGDIRSKSGSFYGRYALNELPRLVGQPGPDGPGRLSNCVFILHHPWFVYDRLEPVEAEDKSPGKAVEQ